MSLAVIAQIALALRAAILPRMTLMASYSAFINVSGRASFGFRILISERRRKAQKRLKHGFSGIRADSDQVASLPQRHGRP
jgi:hypothetical protein